MNAGCSYWEVVRATIVPILPTFAGMIFGIAALSALLKWRRNGEPALRGIQRTLFKVGLGALVVGFVISALQAALYANALTRIPCDDFYQRLDKARQTLPWERR